MKENHLLVNKVSSQAQYQRIVRTLSDTTGNFLNCRLNVLGGIGRLNLSVDKFDEALMERENSSLHRNFVRILKRFTEENVGTASFGYDDVSYIRPRSIEQDVLTVS